MKSIVTKDLKVCAVCGTLQGVETHHCIHGTSGRKLATKYHLLVGLCSYCHRGTYGVHGKKGAELDLYFKQTSQKCFENKYSHEKWMEVFQKNYLAFPEVDFEEVRKRVIEGKMEHEISQ